MFKRVSAGVGAMALLLVAACSGGSDKASEDDPIVFAAVIAGTEPYAAFGPKQKAAINLAVERVNEAGGVLGRDIEVITEDLGADASSGVAAVQKLLSRDPAALLGVQFSFLAFPLVPIIDREKVPTVLGATTPELNSKDKGSPFYFRATSSDDVLGEAEMGLAADTLKVKTAAILNSDDELGISFNKQVKASAEEAGIRIVSDQRITAGSKDFTAQLQAIKKAKPDVVFTHMLVPTSAQVAAQRNRLGLDGIPMIWGPEISVAQGFGLVKWPDLRGDFLVADPLAEYSGDASTRDWAKEFKDKSGQTADFLTTQWYNGVLLMAQGMDDAGSTDPEKVATALRKISDFTDYKGVMTSGVSMTCDAGQNCKQGMDAYEIGDDLTYVASFKPSS